MTLVDWARECLFREQRRAVHRAADTDADDLRRTWIRTGVLDDLHNGLLHALYTIGRNEHFHAGLILRAKALRRNRNAETVTGDDPRVDDTRRIILCVLTIKKRLRNNGLAQIAFRVALCDPLVNRILQKSSRDVKILSDFDKHDGHPRILAIRTILLARNLSIADDLIQNDLTDRRLLCLPALLEAFIDVVGEIVRRFFAHLGDVLRDFFCG